jgi:hypothetical protein
MSHPKVLDAPFGGKRKFGVAPPYLDKKMFYGYKNILPIHPPPNLRFGRGLLGNKVKNNLNISKPF